MPKADPYAAQRESRARKLKDGWKRVEAFLDPETAEIWDMFVEAHGGPTALVKDALTALRRTKRKRVA